LSGAGEIDMDTTHFLYLAVPPRSSFIHDATPQEHEVLEQHFAYLRRLADEGKLLLAGPTLDGAYGVAILKLTKPEEVAAVIRNDPAVVAGLFEARLHPISAAILAS
jgi:uncharacterized protein YciI